MKTIVKSSYILAIGALLAACGQSTDNPLPLKSGNYAQIPKTPEVATPNATPVAIVPNEKAPIGVPPTAVAIQTQQVKISEPLGQEFMRMHSEFKADLNCVQTEGDLPLAVGSKAHFNFASVQCPASGAVESRAIAFHLTSEAMLAPIENQQKLMVQRGFLILKGNVQKQMAQRQQQEVKEVERKVGEFEVRTYTEQVPVACEECKQRQQGQKQAPIEEFKMVERKEIVLTKLCTDEYASACKLEFDKDLFSTIVLLETISVEPIPAPVPSPVPAPVVEPIPAPVPEQGKGKNPAHPTPKVERPNEIA